MTCVGYSELVAARRACLTRWSVAQYLWNRSRCLDRKHFLADLSEPLASEIAMHLHQNLVRSVPLFREAEPEFIVALVRRLAWAAYLPSDLIIREGEVGREMYFVNKGAMTGGRFAHATANGCLSAQAGAKS